MSYTPPVGNATTTKPGLIQLSGDLSGTATNPTLATGAIDATNLSANAVTSAALADGSVTEPKLAVSNAPSASQVLSWDGSAMTWATSSGGTVYDDGARFLESFPGATDDDKLTAAIAWQQATAGMPAIKLSAKLYNFNVVRTLYSGLKLIGSPAGTRNIEISSGNMVPTRIRLGSAITNGANSWWVAPAGTNDYYDIYMAEFGIDGKSSAGAANEQQFIDCYYDNGANKNNMYACQFHALSFNFMYGVMGNATRKCAITQTQFTGHWTVNNIRGVQFHLGGADNNLWMEGYLNMGPNGSGAYQGSGYTSYQAVFDSLTKTNIGFMFVTALYGWRGILVSGSQGHGLRFFGGAYEGMNSGLPAPGTTIRLEGGSGAFFSPSVGQGMANPDTTNEKGLIHITGGEWSFHSPTFYKNGMSASTPFIYASGGRVYVAGAGRHEPEGWTSRPPYQFISPVVAGPNSGENVFYCPDMSMVSV